MILEFALALAAAVCAMAYSAVFADGPPSFARAVARMGAMAALAGLTLARGGPHPLIAALALSAVGDACLAGDPKIWAPVGLGALVLGQVDYVWLFLQTGGGRAALMAEPARNLAVAAVVAVGAALVVWLWDHLADRRLAAVCSLALAILAAMAATALTLPRFFWPAMPGAVGFFAAGGLMAMHLSKGPSSRASTQAVWWLYVLAQTAIAYAFLR